MAQSTRSALDRRQFEVRHCLGAGGFGEVYLATMLSPGGVRTEVALKMLHQGLDPKGQAVERLKDEARLLGLLNHPSILRIHDLVLLDGRVTLVTEYVAGADLDTCFDAANPPPLSAALQVVGRVADALHTAWISPGPDGRPLGLLHRDIKPSNIRIGRHGEVKLLDFGIAKAAGVNREAKTQTDTIVGSFPYMAPERFDGVEPADPTTSDVFSLGCTLFEAVAGQRLFDLEVRQMFALAMVEARHRAHVSRQLDGLSGAPPQVISLLRQLLSYDPAERPPIGALGAACEDLAEQLGGGSLRRWCRAHPWLAPDPSAAAGSMTGRTLTEASLSHASLIASHRSAARPSPSANFAGEDAWPTLDPQLQPELPPDPSRMRRPGSTTLPAVSSSPSLATEPTPRRSATRAPRGWLAISGAAGLTLAGALAIVVFVATFALGLYLAAPG